MSINDPLAPFARASGRRIVCSSYPSYIYKSWHIFREENLEERIRTLWTASKCAVMATKLELFFCYFVFVKCIAVLHELVTPLTQRYTTYASACWGQTSSQAIPDLAESSSLVFWQFVSARQTTLRTLNTCGNVLVLPRAMIVWWPSTFLAWHLALRGGLVILSYCKHVLKKAGSCGSSWIKEDWLLLVFVYCEC